MNAGRTSWTRIGAGGAAALAVALVAQACWTEGPVANEDLPADEQQPVVAPATRIDPAAEPPAANESLARLREAINPLPPTDERPGGQVALSESPTFTPMTHRPEILNRDEVMRSMEQEYPPLLRDAGIGGTARVHFFIDEEGVVRNALIGESSGHRAIDEAALRVADVYRFSPALNGEERVPVWVQFNISFLTR